MPNQRHWCATFFKCADLDKFKGRYMIAGEEKCPTSGKIHWQCYMEFKEKVSMKHIKDMFQDKTIHLEPRRGEREQARDYCKKDGKYTETGIWATGQGFRTDLVSVGRSIMNGEIRIEQVMAEEPELYCKYRNGLKDIQGEADRTLSKEFREVNVKVISGPTGCGKTRDAMERAQYKIEGDNLKWWNGYTGEECICIDEYDNDIKITKLLNLLDGYQLRLEVKGGHTYARWTEVIITTNLRKEQLHAQAKPAHREALFRRITEWEDRWPGGEVLQGNTIPAAPLTSSEKKYEIDRAPHGVAAMPRAAVCPGWDGALSADGAPLEIEGACRNDKEINILCQGVGLIVHDDL